MKLLYQGEMVREGGLEPPRPCGRWILNPLRLPFRHSRIASLLPVIPTQAKPHILYRQKFNSPCIFFLPSRMTAPRLPSENIMSMASWFLRPCALVTG